MPMHWPCCQTLQVSHWTKNSPALSSSSPMNRESRVRGSIREEWTLEMGLQVTDADVGTRSGRENSHREGDLGAKRHGLANSRYPHPMSNDLMESRPRWEIDSER